MSDLGRGPYSARWCRTCDEWTDHHTDRHAARGAPMDLIEFLEARLAEDDRAVTVQRMRDSRLRREVEAKRAILKLSPNHHNLHCILGTIYADHPDYDERWKR